LKGSEGICSVRAIFFREKDQERAIQPIQIQDAMEEGFNEVCDIIFYRRPDCPIKGETELIWARASICVRIIESIGNFFHKKWSLEVMSSHSEIRAEIT
jgi:hypothetical protein